nr:MAG: capsid protein [ssDNA virus sp.]WCR62283.1 MAG: capsid protein [ssDNA virus sp.]
MVDIFFSFLKKTKGVDFFQKIRKMDPRTRNSSRRNVQSISKAVNNNNQMANYYRQTSYRRRYSRYRGKRSSVRGSARGEYRAALFQRDSARQILKWSHEQKITINANAKEGGTCFSAWTALQRSGFFNNFAQMYDQIKLNGVKVKITLLSASSSIYSATNNPVFASAWDRNGLSGNASFMQAPSFTVTSSYGSALTRPLTQGANFGVTRYIYASTMSEKSQYVATALLPGGKDDYPITEEWQFRPVLLMAIYSASSSTSQQELTFNVEWQFDVTFRGTRNDPNAVI